MLKITTPKANRLDIELNGAVDADTMRMALEDLVEKSEGISGGKMLYTIKEFSMPTLGAFGVEFGMLPKLFGLLGKFDKCAVLSDAAWLRTAAEIEGAIIPGLAIKSFEPTEIEQAEAWLAA
ncbi:STAS/SEC14 domain-containing protein [Yoonia maritima]|uniref:STAS/SEC14 domain-containing protein n=1 Tax=Yoonia maritima TaxID=1435347 RepID=UPI00373585EC